jgi:hypothetical protein
VADHDPYGTAVRGKRLSPGKYGHADTFRRPDDP